MNYDKHSILIILLFVCCFLIIIEKTQASMITGVVRSLDDEDFIHEKEDCSYKWNCSEWSKCINRIQTRDCKNIGTCSGQYRKPAEERKCSPILPAQLFDIKLELESKIISNSSKLKALTTFESFGTEPTPVNLTYIILDDSGNEVYSELGEVTVYTEELVIHSFDNTNLGLGKYTLELIIEYANVIEEFRQDFEIKKEKISYESYFAISFIILVVLFFLVTKNKINTKSRLGK